MTQGEQIITILIAAVATLMTRFLPFVIFKGKKTPKALDYLGFALPASVFGMLLVYALKDTVVTPFPLCHPRGLGTFGDQRCLSMEEEHFGFHRIGNYLLYVFGPGCVLTRTKETSFT